MAPTPKNFRTFNPWGHVSRADRMNRQRILAEITDKLAGKTWRIWERPVGPDDETLRHAGSRYDPHIWKAFRHAYASREEAEDKLFAHIGKAFVERVDGEYRKYGMRYIICEEDENDRRRTGRNSTD